MTQLELLADVLNRNIEMLKATLADFSDADMLVRPAPAANHAAWQLGHLVNAESGMINMTIPGAVPPPPAAFEKKFSKETSKIDDPAAFLPKDEMLAALSNARAATIAWVKTLQPADFDKPGPERMRDFIPTVGHMVQMLPGHVMMHVGQFQVIRRKLGKPILF